MFNSHVTSSTEYTLCYSVTGFEENVDSPSEPTISTQYIFGQRDKKKGARGIVLESGKLHLD